jgi:hypothetical protein
MNSWALLAPGPSAPSLVSQALRCERIGVVGNAFQLVDRAEFLVAVDRGWWLKHPEALAFDARHYCSTESSGTERTGLPTDVNSGVAGMEIAKQLGAKSIRLYGFDMHGSHYFGPYTNGLRNTTEARRKVMLRQFEDWRAANRSVEVINCTPGSAITCFPFGESHVG